MLQLFQHDTQLAKKLLKLLSKKEKSNNRKFSAFVFSALLRQFFTSNTAIFWLWRRKNVLPQA